MDEKCKNNLGKLAMDLQLLSIPVLLAFLLIAPLILRRNDRSKTKLPPGPLKLPIIGNMHQLVGSLPHRGLADLAEKYGPLMHLQLGETSNIVVSSPEMAKEVLKTHDLIFANRPFHLAGSILSYESKNIAYAKYGDYWRELRKICALELLSSKRVQSFRSTREEEVSKLVRSISSSAGLPINLSKKIFALTFSIVSRTAFGGECKYQEEFVSHIKQVVEVSAGFSVADVFPSHKWLHVLSGMKAKLLNLQARNDRILRSIIDEHKAKNSASKRGDRRETDDEDLLDVLLKFQGHRNETEFHLANDNIKAVILDIFGAGSETSSTTIEWAMSEMLKNPRVLKKAQAEVRQVYGDKANVDETKLDELKFLKLVIKETLRLRPPGPFLLPRECGESCEINGYSIPAKTTIIVNIWAIGRDSKHWTEPETFLPERFLESSVDYKGANFDFIPFGSGRRICPGMLFGLANVELPLANLLYHFDWKTQDGTDLEDLDMTEFFAVTVRRKKDLHLVPVLYDRGPFV